MGVYDIADGLVGRDLEQATSISAWEIRREVVQHSSKYLSALWNSILFLRPLLSPHPSSFLVITLAMDANAFNNQFPQGMPPGQQGYLQQTHHVPFLTPSQMQLPSAYCQGPQGQAWLPQDGFAPPTLPSSQPGVPRWMQPVQPRAFAQQHQQILQPIGDLQQPVQHSPVREYLSQQAGQGYHPQPSLQEYHPQHPVRGYLSQHSVQDLVAAVAVQLGYTRNVDQVEAIAQCVDNDKVIIGALKQGKAKGLNDLVAIEKLGNANGHANDLWKNYALARLQKIYPQVHPTCSTRRGIARSKVSSGQTGSRQRPSLGGLKHLSRSQSGTNSRNCAGTDSHANPIPFTDRRLGYDYQAYQPSSPISRHEGPSPTNIQVRSRRGGPIPEYHAGTLIPPLDPSSPPKLPLRHAADDHDSNRFTDEDKIFFIHFLKWYLRQGRMTQIPEREDLYILLARQTPHHNAEAWKRHWDDAPELPDKIYIEARKRADDEALARSASLSPSSSGDDLQADSSIDAAENEPHQESASPVLKRGGRVGRCPRRAKKGVKVIGEDLREMAKYKYERRDVWDQYPNAKARWEEFSQRPQNHKRPLIAWYTVSRDYNEEIARYYNDAANAAVASAEKSEVDAESELEYLDVTTPPQHDLRVGSASGSTSSGTDAHTVDEVLTLPGVVVVPQKRDRTETETACSVGAEEPFPAAKRVKEEEDEKPELIEVDSD